VFLRARIGYGRRMAKKKRTTATNVKPSDIEKAIFLARGHRVMLDSDLARLYGVTTAALNQAVRETPTGSPTILLFRLRSKSLQL
jgi:hypothetical protein